MDLRSRRTAARAIALALLLAAPAAHRAEEPERITLRVGEQRTLGGYAPVCDDPAVAFITADGAGVLVAKGEGKTLCSLQQPGGRHVYQVVVLPKGEPARRITSPSSPL